MTVIKVILTIKTINILSKTILCFQFHFSHSVVSDSLRPHESQHAKPSLSVTKSWSSLKFTSIESVMPSTHLILYHPLLFLPPITPSISLFIIGGWNAKVRIQEIPGVTGKFGFGVQNEAGQRLTKFHQENALVIANTLFQQHKRRFHMWTSPDGQ